MHQYLILTQGYRKLYRCFQYLHAGTQDRGRERERRSEGEEGERKLQNYFQCNLLPMEEHFPENSMKAVLVFQILVNEVYK